MGELEGDRVPIEVVYEEIKLLGLGLESHQLLMICRLKYLVKDKLYLICFKKEVAKHEYDRRKSGQVALFTWVFAIRN